MRLSVSLPDKMEEKLDKITEETGLGKSEIARRGLLEQLRELEDDSSE